MVIILTFLMLFSVINFIILLTLCFYIFKIITKLNKVDDNVSFVNKVFKENNIDKVYINK